MRTARRSSAFTLAELLVVLAILAVLLSMLLPAVQKVREVANTIKTHNHLRQVASACHSHNDAFGRLPSAAGTIPASVVGSTTTYVSWAAQVLPYLEPTALPEPVAAIFASGSWYQRVIPIFLSPSDASNTDGKGFMDAGVSNLAANFQVFGDPSSSGLNALINGRRDLARSFPDGTSNTILLGTKYGQCGPGGSLWGFLVIAPYYLPNGLSHTHGAYFGHLLPDANGVGFTFQVRPTERGDSNPCNPDYAQAFSYNGLSVALADGSVRTVSADISGLTWRHALLPADNQVLGSDW